MIAEITPKVNVTAEELVTAGLAHLIVPSD